jgi:P4 family phage/plasmid primase-like protien
MRQLLDAPELLDVPDVDGLHTSAVFPGSNLPGKLSEFQFATLLAATLPPIKTVGDVWYVYRNGVWQTQSAHTLKPAALAIIPENARTIRRASTLLDHIAAAKQTDGSTFEGFHVFDASGAVLINARNGVVRVTENDFELLPHSAEHHFTRQTGACFKPHETAPLFHRVLGEVLPDAEDRELFQLCIGNFLFPDSRFETALVCYGEAGRGKSTVADPVAAALGVDLVSRLSMSQICDPRSYHLPALRFAAVNLGTELTTADIAESGNFKTLVSGEPIEARPIYGKPFVMQTAAKLWFLANSLPRFKHGTEAELRRTRFLRFDYQPLQKDVTLKARLAGEMDGVLTFMLQGLRALLALAEIPIGGRESRAVHERFRISNDPVGAFVQSRCVLSPDGLARKDALRDSFADFSSRNELPPVCSEWFFRVLFERFTALRETQPRVAGERVRHVSGVSLRSNSLADTE